MKNLKTWELFTESLENITEKKNYTPADIKKDYRRIEDMKEKAKDKDHLLKLAKTMANSIKNGEKAYRRGMAAKDSGEKDVAKIFLDRAKDLNFVNEGKKTYDFVNIEDMNKSGMINVIFYDENDKREKRERFDDMDMAISSADKWEEKIKKKLDK